MLGSLDEANENTIPLLNAYGSRDSIATSVDYDIVCKVIIIGDSGVGKTCLFKRFNEDSFTEDHVPTTSVEFTHRFIDTLESRCKVQVWDCITSGSHAIMKSVYKGSSAVVLLYDVCNSDSLAAVVDWVSEVREYTSGDVLIYLVGTKIDEIRHRLTTFEQGEDLARTMHVNYWELSSKTGQDVDTLFYKIVANYSDLQRSSINSSSLFTSSSHASGSVRESELLKQEDSMESSFSSSFCPCAIS